MTLPSNQAPPPVADASATPTGMQALQIMRMLSGQSAGAVPDPTQAQPAATPPPASAAAAPAAQKPAAATPSGPPTIGKPILWNLIQGLRNPASQAPAGGAAPTRGAVFENFLGNFLGALSQGLASAGRGPGSAARGFAAAEMGPYNIALQHYGLQQQQANMEAQRSEEQQRTAMEAGQAAMYRNTVMTPYGPMPLALAARIIPSMVGAGAKLGAANIAAASKIDVANLMNGSPVAAAKAFEANAKGQLALAGNDPSSPVYKLALQKVQWANYFKRQSLSMRQQSLQLQRQKFQQQVAGPTSNMRTMGQMAQTTLDQIPRIKAEIAALGASDKLGPIQGRFNDFMTGKVGAGDPAYAALRTDLTLFSTALVKAHVGARGSRHIMGEFKSMLDSGRSTPEQLDASMGVISSWLQTYAGQANAPAPGVKPLGAPAPVPAAKPKGGTADSILGKYRL